MSVLNMVHYGLGQQCKWLSPSAVPYLRLWGDSGLETFKLVFEKVRAKLYRKVALPDPDWTRLIWV